MLNKYRLKDDVLESNDLLAEVCPCGPENRIENCGNKIDENKRGPLSSRVPFVICFFFLMLSQA